MYRRFAARKLRIQRSLKVGMSLSTFIGGKRKTFFERFMAEEYENYFGTVYCDLLLGLKTVDISNRLIILG